MSTDPREEVRHQILDAFGVTAEEVERADVLLGGPVLRERQRRYMDALPRRIAAVEQELNERYAGVLPEGMRFEWTAKEPPPP